MHVIRVFRDKVLLADPMHPQRRGKNKDLSMLNSATTIKSGISHVCVMARSLTEKIIVPLTRTR